MTQDHLLSFCWSPNLTPTHWLPMIIRSSHQKCSVRKGVLRNFTTFTGKHLCQSLFFNKVTGLWTAFLLKKRLWHRCSPVNFAKFLRTAFLQNTSRRLLLDHLRLLLICVNVFSFLTFSPKCVDDSEYNYFVSLSKSTF